MLNQATNNNTFCLALFDKGVMIEALELPVLNLTEVRGVLVRPENDPLDKSFYGLTTQSQMDYFGKLLGAPLLAHYKYVFMSTSLLEGGACILTT